MLQETTSTTRGRAGGGPSSLDLMHLENLSQEQIAPLFRELARPETNELDYYCWDVYAKGLGLVRRR